MAGRFTYNHHPAAYWCHTCDMSIALPPSPTPNSLLCPHCHLDSLEQLDHNINNNNNLIHLDDDDLSLTAAPKSLIDSLPEIIVKTDDDEMCPVCKDVFVIESVVKVMPCVHRFHSGCIVPWLEINNSCPVCRFKLPRVEKDVVVVGEEEEEDDDFVLPPPPPPLPRLWPPPFPVLGRNYDGESGSEGGDDDDDFPLPPPPPPFPVLGDVESGSEAGEEDWEFDFFS